MFPNHSVPTPFQGATQCVFMSHSPIWLDELISSGGEAFWRIWNAQGLPKQQIRLQLLLVSGVRLENLLTSGSLDWRPSRENLCFVVAIDWGFTYFLSNTVGISPNFSLLGWCCFWMFVAHQHAWESGSNFFFFFCELIANFQTCLEQIFTKFKSLRFPVKGGHLCCEGFWAISRLGWYCCWNWLNYCSSPFVEGLTEPWSAWTVTGVFSMRNSGWPVQRVVYCLPGEVPEEQ